MKRSPLRRVGRRGLNLRMLDCLLREVVLRRDGFKCRKCDRGKQRGRGGGLQAAHIFPKGQYPSMRYELQNVVCLCASCHIYGPDAWHRHPIAAQEWAKEHFGTDYLWRLSVTALTRTQHPDHAAIKLMLEQELRNGR